MRCVLVVLLVLACCTGTAQAWQAVRGYRADIALEIDTQGQVTQATPSDELPRPLVAPVQAAVARWRFQPARHDGTAVTARTYARVMVQLVPRDADQYGVQVKYLSNGPSLTMAGMPAYPPELIRGRVEGTVYMQAVVQPDGAVTDVRLQSFDIPGRSVGTPRHSAEVFARAAQRALATMQARPEWADGKPVATTLTLPVTFSLIGGSSLGDTFGSVAGKADGSPD